MFNLDKFISDSVTFRPTSMFAPDIEANKEKLTREIKDKKVCVIGGAGSAPASSRLYCVSSPRVWWSLTSTRTAWQS